MGNVCFHFAAERGCTAYGIEIRQDLHAVAQDVGRLLYADLALKGRKCGSTLLMSGDVQALTREQLDCLKQATIVLVNNVVFSPQLDLAIFMLLKRICKPGTRVLCFKNSFPRLRVAENHYLSQEHPLSAFHLPPHQFLSKQNEVSWTASPIRYLVYVVVPAAPHLKFPIIRGNVFVPKGMEYPADDVLEQEQALLTSWREQCEELAASAVEAQLEQLQENDAPGVVTKKARRKSLPQPLVPVPPTSVDNELAVTVPRVAKQPRRPRWDYVEEIPFLLPPSPPRRSRKPFTDEVQTRGLSHSKKALIRERPRSPSPLRTRGQRRKDGKEVQVLRKRVVWQEVANPTHDDFCARCIQGGLLLCCDGNCWRAFHMECVGLQELPPESEQWFCELCHVDGDGGGAECGICGVQGGTPIECGSCQRVFHWDCVGLMEQVEVPAFTCSQCAGAASTVSPPQPLPRHKLGKREMRELAEEEEEEEVMLPAGENTQKKKGD